MVKTVLFCKAGYHPATSGVLFRQAGYHPATSGVLFRQAGFHPALSHLHRIAFSFFTLLLITTACAPAATPASEPRVINVYATSAAQPWLADVFACAPSGAVIRVADAPEEADISLRIGEPEFVSKPIFQIDSEDILIVMNSARPLSELSLEQVEGLFTGQVSNWNNINTAWGEAHVSKSGEVHVWVYSKDEDIQQVFERFVLKGAPVTSLARLAINPQHMHDEVGKDESAIGFIPRRWFSTGVFEEAVIPNIPVLALVNEEPQGEIRELIACLQKSRIPR